jgi:Polyketide cyclase / dehydrase and lipid transport
MIVNERAALIRAPIATVWQLFTTEEGQRDLTRGFVTSIRFAGSGLGSRRIMRTAGHLVAGEIEEELIRFDPDRHELEYTITDTGGVVPFADYHGWVKLTPAGLNACILALRSSFIPVDLPDAEALALSKANFELVFGNVRRLVAAT